MSVTSRIMRGRETVTGGPLLLGLPVTASTPVQKVGVRTCPCKLCLW